MNIYQAALNSIKNAMDKNKAEEKPLTKDDLQENDVIEMPTYEDLKTRFPDVSEESLQEALTKPSSEWSDRARNELFESSLRAEHPDWSEEQIRELTDTKDEEEEPIVNVPEIETSIKDLPPEDENEKELDVENVPGQNDTLLDENENGVEPPEFDESQVVDPTEPDLEENAVSDTEVNAPVEPPKAEEKKDTPKEEPKAKEEKEKPKAEEKKEKSQYEHLPVGLKVAEDAAGVVADAGNRVERIGNTQLAGSSGGADEVVRQAAIPHYDYRSFFK